MKLLPLTLITPHQESPKIQAKKTHSLEAFSVKEFYPKSFRPYFGQNAINFSLQYEKLKNINSIRAEKEKLSPEEIMQLSKLPQKDFAKIEKYCHLNTNEGKQKELKFEQLYEISQLDDKQFETAKKLRQLYFSHNMPEYFDSFIYFSKLDNEHLKRINICLKDRLNIINKKTLNIAKELTTLSDKDYIRIEPILQRFPLYSQQELKQILKLDQEQINRTKKLSDEYGNPTTILFLGFLPKEDFDNAEKIIKNLKIKQKELLEEINPSIPVISRMSLDRISYIPQLMIMAHALDKETFDYFTSLSAFQIREMLNDQLDYFNFDDINAIKNLINASRHSKPKLTAKDKLEFFDLIIAHKRTHTPLTLINEMTAKNSLNLGLIQKGLLNKIFTNIKMTPEEIESIPQEKFEKWDYKYIAPLTAELAEIGRDTTEQLFRATMLNDFMDYIHNKNNEFGRMNFRTKKHFENYGLDYDKWINPPTQNNIHFIAIDKNLENQKQICNQIIEDIETLRCTPAKCYIDKLLSKYLVNGKFSIPQNIQNNKKKLENFILDINFKFKKVWERAEKNQNKKILTIKDHLNQRLEDISKLKHIDSKKSLDLTIKTWDRIPQKDLFQGNYSTCCIGIGKGNGSAMPHYLMNTAFNMIELVNNKTGKPIGNALIYYIINDKKEPILVLDNIEINNDYKPSKTVGKKLLAALTQYTKNLNKSVANREDIPVCVGSKYNDLPTDDLKNAELNVKLLGRLQCEEIYLDLLDGWTDEFNKKTLAQVKYLNN